MLVPVVVDDDIADIASAVVVVKKAGNCLPFTTINVRLHIILHYYS